MGRKTSSNQYLVVDGKTHLRVYRNIKGGYVDFILPDGYIVPITSHNWSVVEGKFKDGQKYSAKTTLEDGRTVLLHLYITELQGNSGLIETVDLSSS